MDPMKWYALQTMSGQENTAVRNLQQQAKMMGCDDAFGRMLVPEETTVDSRTNRKQTRRFFPGYVFVEMRHVQQEDGTLGRLEERAKAVVRDTPRVHFAGAMRTGRNAAVTADPAPVPPPEVERLMKLVQTEDAPRPVVDFTLGEEVKLTDGRYASMRGTIEDINEARGKLRVVINMFGRPVPTEVSFHQVEKLT